MKQNRELFLTKKPAKAGLIVKKEPCHGNLTKSKVPGVCNNYYCCYLTLSKKSYKSNPI